MVKYLINILLLLSFAFTAFGASVETLENQASSSEYSKIMDYHSDCEDCHDHHCDDSTCHLGHCSCLNFLKAKSKGPSGESTKVTKRINSAIDNHYQPPAIDKSKRPPIFS